MDKKNNMIRQKFMDLWMIKNLLISNEIINFDVYFFTWYWLLKQSKQPIGWKIVFPKVDGSKNSLKMLCEHTKLDVWMFDEQIGELWHGRVEESMDALQRSAKWMLLWVWQYFKLGHMAPAALFQSSGICRLTLDDTCPDMAKPLLHSAFWSIGWETKIIQSLLMFFHYRYLLIQLEGRGRDTKN